MATKTKLVRDPVHDLIVFNLGSARDRLLLRLIDCAEFQRLRRIRQLGMAYLVFPGAEHSRFCHSIGVMHLARRMMELLGRDRAVPELAAVAVECAALLHDLGHGPFSHVIERFLRDRHEVWTRRIILAEGTEVNACLRAFDPQLPALVAAALEGRLQPAWLNLLVGSQLDADRFDYLTRDSLMTGVKYGIFDLERLLLMLRVDEAGTRVFVEGKGLLPVEKYLQSRYHMYRQVYFHKTVTAGESMLTALLRRARDLARRGECPGMDMGSGPARLLAAEEGARVEDYLRFDDVVLQGWLAAWADCRDPVLSDLAARLRARRLFKTIEMMNFDEQDMMVRMRVAEAREAVCDAGLDPEYYLLFVESEDTPYHPYNPRADGPGSTIWTEDPDRAGVLCDVKEMSPTIRAFTESPYTIWRAVFAPEAGNTRLRPVLERLLKC